MTVLVTGAGGFIGSHLVEELLARGATVRAFVRYTSRADDGYLAHLPRDDARKLQIVRGDLRDSGATRDAVLGCRVVFHLGALIGIPYSYVHPREVVETNVIGTLNLLEAARHADLGRFVHTSSSEVYGTAQAVRICESHVLQAQSPYSASKIGADKLVESYCRSFGIPGVTVRPFNTYGPRQSLRAVIPTIISQALSRDEIRLGSLAPTRDFTYVDDTVRGFVNAATADPDRVIGREINLGTGGEIRIGDLAVTIARLAGRTVTVACDDRRLRPQASEVERLCSDNSLAKKLLDWEPRVDLEEGLKRTIAWVRDHLATLRTDLYHV
jgi:dTDP-glucose 4,6-dehydratase